ncbi:hypothetical protein HYV81_03085 [Candidatus Woesearchaeota archaeon]|nr:hypothetical protein [Candidatus Woesearchaeota archaeon]
MKMAFNNYIRAFWVSAAIVLPFAGSAVYDFVRERTLPPHIRQIKVTTIYESDIPKPPEPEFLDGIVIKETIRDIYDNKAYFLNLETNEGEYHLSVYNSSTLGEHRTIEALADRLKVGDKVKIRIKYGPGFYETIKVDHVEKIGVIPSSYITILQKGVK